MELGFNKAFGETQTKKMKLKHQPHRKQRDCADVATKSSRFSSEGRNGRGHTLRWRRSGGSQGTQQRNCCSTKQSCSRQAPVLWKRPVTLRWTRPLPLPCMSMTRIALQPELKSIGSTAKLKPH